MLILKCSKCNVSAEAPSAEALNKFPRTYLKNCPLTLKTAWRIICKTCVSKERKRKHPQNKERKKIVTLKNETKQIIKTICCRVCGLSADIASGEAQTLFYHKYKNVPINTKAAWQNRCKECTKKYKTIYYDNNKERVEQTRKDKYWSNPELARQKQRVNKLKKNGRS